MAAHDLSILVGRTLSTIFSFVRVNEVFWSEHYDTKFYTVAERPFVSTLGPKVRNSGVMRVLRRRLSPFAFYHAENLLLRPFSVAEPPVSLPITQATDVVARLQFEMDKIRDLTGMPLRSLDVTLDQATSSA